MLMPLILLLFYSLDIFYLLYVFKSGVSQFSNTDFLKKTENVFQYFCDLAVAKRVIIKKQIVH